MPTYSPSEMMERAAAAGTIGGAQRAYRPSHTEVLQEKRKALEAELSRVNEALRALEDHPEIEKVMNLVNQALY